MKLSNFSLPYPVLGLEDNYCDSAKCEYEFSFRFTEKDYIFSVKYAIDDQAIIDLIEPDKDGRSKALYACELDCPRSYYRKVFMSSKPEFDIQLPRTSLVGPVAIFFSVVAVDEIPAFSSPNFNPLFYSGYSFALTPGDMLVYFGERTFQADIKYEELKAISSIIEVKKDPTADYTYFDFSADKIRIFLPEEEFAWFNTVNNLSYADISHASIVQCALTSALYSYKDYSDCLWAVTLATRVGNETALAPFRDLEHLDGGKIAQLVDKLLKNPNKRMYNRLNRLTTVED